MYFVFKFITPFIASETNPEPNMQNSGKQTTYSVEYIDSFNTNKQAKNYISSDTVIRKHLKNTKTAELVIIPVQNLYLLKKIADPKQPDTATCLSNIITSKDNSKKNV